jgi:hypothetical protein
MNVAETALYAHSYAQALPGCQRSGLAAAQTPRRSRERPDDADPALPTRAGAKRDNAAHRVVPIEELEEARRLTQRLRDHSRIAVRSLVPDFEGDIRMNTAMTTLRKLLARRAVRPR